MEKLPIKYFDTHSHGDIMSIYTNDIDTLRQMISQSIPQVFSSFITVVGTLGSMLVLSVPLTAVSLIMVALMMFVTGKVAGLSGKYFVKQQKNIGKVNGYIEEMVEGQKVVKVFCHEDKSLELSLIHILKFNIAEVKGTFVTKWNFVCIKKHGNDSF